MIDKFIEQIKEKLPFLNRDDEEYEDEEEEGSGSTAQFDMTTSKLAIAKLKGRQKKFRKDEDDEYEDEDEEDASAKRGKIIRMIAAVVVVYFGVTEFVLKEELSPQPVKKVTKKKETRKKPIKKKSIDLAVSKPKSTQKDSVVKNNIVPNVKPVRPKSNPKLEPNSVEVQKPESINNISVEEISLNNSDMDKSLNNELNDIEKSLSQDFKADSNLEGQLDKITQKIIEEQPKEPIVEFTEAPDYEKFGRGLVYNCKRGHWACVDKESYIKCRNHNKWSAQNNKKTDCITAPVYSSNSDCRKMQLYKINKVEIPDCK